MDDQPTSRKGLSPELLDYISPERRRERQEEEIEMMETRIRAEIHLENARRILERMKRQVGING